MTPSVGVGPEEVALAILLRHVPDVLAQSMLRRASAASGGDASRLIEELRVSVQLFVEPRVQSAIMRALDSIAPPSRRADVARERVVIAAESDVSRARLRARELSQLLGAGAFGQQRASTSVSELARNIVMYAGNGHIELIARRRQPPSLSVRAVDFGPGIKDPDAILNGSYRSKTGLGRGLRGVKQLASSFSLQTSVTGTIVDAEIPL
jgi:serine/threonine-protein kinase RsbT